MHWTRQTPRRWSSGSQNAKFRAQHWIRPRLTAPAGAPRASSFTRSWVRAYHAAIEVLLNIRGCHRWLLAAQPPRTGLVLSCRMTLTCVKALSRTNAPDAKGQDRRAQPQPRRGQRQCQHVPHNSGNRIRMCGAVTLSNPNHAGRRRGCKAPSACVLLPRTALRTCPCPSPEPFCRQTEA